MALAAAIIAACCCTVQLGYPLLTLTLIPALLPCLWLAWQQRAAGGCLTWRDGAWFWSSGRGGQRPVELAPDPVLLPHLLQLRWRPVGEYRWRQLWLFPDSADAVVLRRLRRQLRLQG